MNIKFSFTIPASTADTPDQLLAFIASLIPSPLPSDLSILVTASKDVAFSYSRDYATPLDAANAALAALKGQCPP